HAGEATASASLALDVLDLELVVDLPRRLADQEEAAADQDEVASTQAVAPHREQRPRESHHPRDREEQPDADAQRERQPEPPRRATARYVDVATARADGYLQASGMEARHGYHFVQPAAQARALATGTLDLAAPPVLLYVERDGLWQLVGVEYALPSVPPDDALPGAVWHAHE